MKAGEPSDPFLMTGFNRKVLHLQVASGDPAEITIEVDFLGMGRWAKYETLSVSGYRYHIFPEGFSAHWVQLVPGRSCNVTAEFLYT